MKKKVLSVLLAATMVVSMAGCGKKATPAAESFKGVTYDELSNQLYGMDYETASETRYDANLGDFWSLYQDALKEQNISLKYAKEAIAEAKLMEDAVLLPTQSRGGNYAISNIATRSGSTVLWGNDSDRYHSLLICVEPIKNTDQTALKELWASVQGTGTYLEKAKAYLKDQGYTLKDTYNYGSYVSDAATWDVLATSRQSDSEKVIHTYDGLLEYDCENVQRPALAESYEISADGLTWTFHIRQGVKWVDSQGREVADVCADDFVAGMQHMMDAQGGLEYLVGGEGAHIVNADEYIAGTISDFSQVGVKAKDDYTLVYTLTEPTPYFATMLGYGCFAPMSRSYYESQGGKFGADYDPAASDYKYGLGPDNIAYCGPYLVTNFTAGSTIVYKASDSYWNKDEVNIKTMTWKYNDGSDALKQYNGFKAGELDGCGLNANALEQAKNDNMFDDYHYISATDATSFCAFLNVNRMSYMNFNDDAAAVSTQSMEELLRTNKAMNNVHFRRAFCFAVDRGAYNAQSVGEELKLNSVRNSYTPGNFVMLEEEVTVDINGTSKTYPAGTFYGQIMQDQIDADGVAMKVWDAETMSGDGFDGWYSPENAMAELKLAIEELKEQDVTINKRNPIYMDLPYPSNAEVYTNRANAIKQSVEASLGGQVIVNLVECVDTDQWYATGYDTTYGHEANYDMYDVSGWGPDYGDPQTYLNTMAPDGAGYMTKCLGLY